MRRRRCLAYADFDNTSAGKPDKVPLKTWEPHVQRLEGGRSDLARRQGQGTHRRAELPRGQRRERLLLPHLQRRRRRRQRLALHRARRRSCTTTARSSTNGASSSITPPRSASTCISNFRRTKWTTTASAMNRKPGRVPESLDGGKLGIERKLYCRELIARFGHALALNWNIGEENTQSTEEVRDMVKYPPRHRSLPASHRPPHLPAGAGEGVSAAARRQVPAHRRVAAKLVEGQPTQRTLTWVARIRRSRPPVGRGQR